MRFYADLGLDELQLTRSGADVQLGFGGGDGLTLAGFFIDATSTSTSGRFDAVEFADGSRLSEAQLATVLPGGAGSLDEFFEVLTWAQIGLHAKPVFLVNVNGYWQPLLDLLSHIIAQGFADASLLGHFTVVSDVAALEVALAARLS